MGHVAFLGVDCYSKMLDVAKLRPMTESASSSFSTHEQRFEFGDFHENYRIDASYRTSPQRGMDRGTAAETWQSGSEQC